MTIGVSIVHFVIKVHKVVQMIVTIYRVRTGLSSTHCQSKMAATKFSFFVISTSDRGDFPRIIEIALFPVCSYLEPSCVPILSGMDVGMSLL